MPKEIMLEEYLCSFPPPSPLPSQFKSSKYSLSILENIILASGKNK